MPITYKFLTSADDSHSQSWSSPAAWIYAGAGDDWVNSVSAVADTVDGGAGNDTLRGDNRDVLIGGAGDDTFHLFYKPGSPGIGHRAVEAAGGGWDFLSLNVEASGTFHMPVNVEALQIVWHDYGQPYLASFKLFGNDSDNIIWGNTQSDTIQGGAGNDSLFGGGQADLLTGDAGDDYLAGEFGADTMWGGYGNDTHDGLAGDAYAYADRMGGSYGDDLYIISENDVVLERIGEGWDTVQTRMGSYTLANNVEELVFTGGGSAALTGNVLGNVIRAMHLWTGPLTIAGGDGADTIRGANANDTIGGDGGNDLASGGGGNDLLRGADGNDTLNGEAGNDAILGDAHNDSITGGDGNDLLEGGTGHDTLDGGSHKDSLRGGEGNDVLAGGTGDDTVLGDSGNDRLLGNGGNDILVGGAGRDTIAGGAGFDAFVFADVAHSGPAAADVIVGFEHGADVINLVGIDADGTYGTYDKFSWVGDAPAVGVKGALWAVENLVGTNIFGDVNGDGVAEMRIFLSGTTGIGDTSFIF